jgi:predicted porin
MSADANKITYFTPRMSGFQLGISYTPSNDGFGAPAGPGTGLAGGFPGAGLGTSNPATGTGYSNGLGLTSDANGGLETILELGGSYVGEYSNVGIKLSAAYAVGDWQAFGLRPNGTGIASPVSSNAEAWHFGGNLTSMGWTLGGAYYGSNNLIPGAGVPGAGRPGRDEEAWNLGVTYAAGPWQAGVSYLHSEQQSTVGAPGKNEYRLWDIGAQYKLGPGVAIGSDLTLSRDKVPGPGTNISPKNLEDKALALTLMLDF